MENYFLTDETCSIDDYSRSLEYIISGATIKSKELSDKIYSIGEGIVSKDFYLGKNLTQNIVEIEIQNSNSVILSIPVTGVYSVQYSHKTFKTNTLKSGSIFLPTDYIRYATNLEIIDDLIVIINYSQLVPLLEQRYGLFVAQERCFDFDINNPRIRLHYELMINNLQLLRLYPHLRDSVHFKVSIKEVAKLLLVELIADSYNVDFKLRNKPESFIVSKAEEIMDAEAEKLYTIQEIAGKVSTTPRNLQLAFRKHRGYTPMKFLRERKLYKAKIMLLNGDSYISIKEVAYKSGFTNISSFSKYYRELYGELPSETLKKTG